MSTRIRNIVLVALLILIVIALGACVWYFFEKPHSQVLPSSAASSTPVSVSSGSNTSAEISATHIIQSGTYYTADLQYPSATPLPSSEASANDAIVATLKKFSEDTLSSFIQNGHFDTLSASDASDEGLHSGQKFSISDGYTEYSGAHTISYVFSIDENTLGAHPVTLIQTYTFASNTGAQLSLADLFASQSSQSNTAASSNYLSQLSSISRTALTKQLGDNADSTFIDAGTTADATNFSDFAIDGTDLLLIFPPYKVAPGSLGTQMIRIPLSELGVSTS